MKISLVIIFLFLSSLSFCQEIIAFRTLFNDSFRTWELDYVDDFYTEEAEILNGSLELTWGIGNNWHDYTCNVGDERANIKYKQVGIMPLIELTNWSGETISARKVWPRDYSEWIIKLDEKEYTLQLLFTNDIEEWIIKSDNILLCNILTTNRGDLRSWFFDYKTDEKMPLSLQQLAMVTIIYLVCPKV